MFGFKEKIMKVIFISRDFPDIKGGVSDYTYYLSKEFAKKGMEVYVLTSDDERINKNIQHIKVLPVVKNWEFKGISKIVEYIKKVNPDWIIFQYVPYMYSYYGVPFWLIFLYQRIKKQGFKICTTFHEVSILIDSGDFKHLPVAISQRIIAYLFSLLSDKIVVPIERWEKMLHFFKRKIKVIPVGSSIVPENEDIKVKKIERKDFIIIGSFGSAHKSRRVDVHLKAVKILKDRGVKVKYIFIGDAPNHLKELAKKLNIDVEFTGYLPKDEVWKKLKTFDFFIFFNKKSNKYEAGISLKNSSMVSAFSACVPVIANKGSLTDKILEGYYIKCPINKTSFVNKTLKFIDNEKNIEELKERTGIFYKNYLRWDKIAKEYILFLLKNTN